MQDELMSIGEISKRLGFSDLRSIEGWCRENEIEMEHIGKNRYIYRVEFEAAANKKLINELLHKYGTRWHEMYLAYMEGDIKTFLELQEYLKNTNHAKQEYKPRRKQEIQFLEEMDQIISSASKTNEK